MFDDVVDPAEVGPRERYEAVARSVRDVLSQRWLLHRAHLRAREPEARLLPVDGVPDRPLAGQQHPQPAARPGRTPLPRREAARLARDARAGARRRPGQRRARPAGGVLSRFDGDDAAAGDGLRAALRVRHLPADDPGRLAARTARQLAAAARPVGGRAAAGDGRDQAQLLVRAARRQPASRSSAGRRA